MTSLNTSVQVEFANERIFHILNAFQLKYKVYDLNNYEDRVLSQDIVNRHGGSSKLPMIFINGVYIGGSTEI